MNPLGIALGLASVLGGRKSSGKGAGLLGLAGSLGSSLLSNRGALKRQRLADRQNIRFWNMQNQYNHPLAQMKRLQEAGLNPNLIYGSSVAGATGSAGSIAPSKAAPYSIANPVPSAVQTALAPNQKKLLGAQEIKTLADADLTGKLSRDRDLKINDELKELRARRKIAESSAILKGLEEQGMSQYKAEYFESLLSRFEIEKSKSIVEALNAKIAQEYELRPSDPLWYRELKSLVQSIKTQIKSWKDLPKEVRQELLNRINPFKID
jgi:hypothetical protein